MTITLQLFIIVISVGGLLVAMASVRWLADRNGWSAELQRKVVHMTTGLYALTLPFTFSEAWPVLALCALALVVMVIMRQPAFSSSKIGSTIHSVARTSYGEILLAISVGFLFFFSTEQPVLFVLPMLVLTFSDAVAALTGVHYGRRLFAVESGTKSLEGVVMFFLCTFVLSLITLLLMTDISRQSVIVISLILAIFGAQIEADSWRGFDNFFVPVGIHLFLQNNLNAPHSDLLASALLYIAILSLLLWAAPRLNLTNQSARGYGVLAFLILSVTAPHNALLPILAFSAFLAVRRTEPCHNNTYPDLDFLAAAAGSAAWWLFVGEWSGHNAINLFNLTFAGVASVFSVLFLRARAPAVAAITVFILGLLVFAVQALNAPEARWIPAFWVWTALSLSACGAMAGFWPDFFARLRALRAFLIALVVPLFLIAWKTLLS